MTSTATRGTTWGTTWGARALALTCAVGMFMGVNVDPAAAGKPAVDATLCESVWFSATASDIRSRINAPASLDGSGVDIAVIDTGITGVDTAVDGADLSFDALNDDLRFEDLNGHGSHMAEIIAGVAPGARIVDVKVGAANGAVDVTQVIAGIDWVVANKNKGGLDIRVINLAYETDADVNQLVDPLTHAVQNAWNHGIVVVAAGGNDGRDVGRLGNPALNKQIIAVGAADIDKDKAASYSTAGDPYGRMPDFIAPGTQILTEGLPGSQVASLHPDATCVVNGKFMIRGNGTSQASAVTSGAIALMLEDRPGLNPNQVKYLLRNSATSIKGNERYTGKGLLNVGAAINRSTPSMVFASQGLNLTTGLGSLDASRGGSFVGEAGNLLQGNLTAFGSWNQPLWAINSSLGTAWTNLGWADGEWNTGTWSGSTWSGSTWSGSTWSGSTWSGSTWSGSTWSGSTWSGSTWSGSTWSGSIWSGSTWSGSTWSSAGWS